MDFVTKLQDHILIIKFEDTAGIGKSLPRICRESAACTESFLHDGGRLVLLDFSRADFDNMPFYDPIVYAISRLLVAECRIAVCLGVNPRISYFGALVHFPCFENEAEAHGYLSSGSPDQYIPQRDHRFWAQIGPEEGPECCKHEGCKNLQIRLGIFCRHHHYEMIKGEKYAGKGGI